jgi:hypothetical protein
MLRDVKVHHTSAPMGKDHEEEAAFMEKWPKDQFIFDVQTHHADLRRHWYDASADGRFIHRLFHVLAPTRTLQEDLEQ